MLTKINHSQGIDFQEVNWPQNNRITISPSIPPHCSIDWKNPTLVKMTPTQHWMVLIPESVTAFRELLTSEGHLSKLLFTRPSFLDTSSEIVENESNCGWLLSNSSHFAVAENIGIMVDSDLESLSAVSESDGSIPLK